MGPSSKPWYLVSWDDLLGPWGCVVLAAGFAALAVWYVGRWGFVFGALGPVFLAVAWAVGAVVQFRRRRVASDVPHPANP